MKNLLKNLCTNLLRPTLVKRLILALLLAFAAVWILLLAVMYWSATSQSVEDKGVQDVGTGLIVALSRIEQDVEARAISQATSDQLNRLYQINQIPALVLIQVRHQDGRLVYLSPQAGNTVFPPNNAQLSNVRALGREFRQFSATTGAWSVVVAASRVKANWLLRSLARDLSLYLIIAFPVILLPLWIAVTSGLRPLRQFSAQLAARGADDLSAIPTNPKYTELIPIAHALNHFLNLLRNKVEREHSFVQNAAHELRTPLAVISAQAHVLKMAQDAPERNEAEQQLNHAVARASHLMTQLLQLARADAQHSAAASKIDVARLVRQELTSAATIANQRDLELSLESPDKLDFLLDVQSFQSLLQNLLSNALRYVQQGGRIEVTLTESATALQLCIADDGPGIKEEDWERVFERFYRGKQQDTVGTGLGLAIVKEAAKKLDATLQLSRGLEGRGCQFLIAIPKKSSVQTRQAGH